MNAQNTASPLILFVDDEATAVKYFQRAVETLAPVVTAGSVEEGKRLLDEHAETLSVLISDQRMPGGYGNDLLRYAHSRYPHIVRILTTAYSELGHTIDAVNQGQIHRYIQKPWDLAALKLELKQALDYAALRKEHAQLLREKLMVRQMQTLSNRIGALHALCLGVAGSDQPSPLESYLSAAATVGIKPPEPNWLLMDYADLVSAEAFRSGHFGHNVRQRLAEIYQAHPDTTDQGALALMPHVLGNAARPAGDGSIVMGDDAQHLVEFLETPCDAPVSAEHAAWLAYLIWLHGIGKSLQITKGASGLQCRLATPTVLTSERLATWISQFSDVEQAGGQATVTSFDA